VSRRRLRLVSHNLHEFVGSQGVSEAERVREALRELAPDVLALQEFHAMRAGVSPLHSLGVWGRVLGMTAVAGFTLRRERAHYGNALLTRLPIREVRRHDLTVGTCEPRGAVEVSLDWQDRELRVLTTHLGLSWTERRRQVRHLIRLLDDRPETPTVLMGDLNDWTPGGWQGRALWRRLPQRSRARTFPAHRPFLALDRIAASVGVRWIRSQAEQSAPFPQLSDHLPLRAEIE
jgi:endonuclease/exonuclease/phosphatase family metal-dependent hydrolase